MTNAKKCAAKHDLWKVSLTLSCVWRHLFYTRTIISCLYQQLFVSYKIARWISTIILLSSTEPFARHAVTSLAPVVSWNRKNQLTVLFCFHWPVYFIEDFSYDRSCKNKTCYHRGTSYAVIKSVYGSSTTLVLEILVTFVSGGLKIEGFARLKKSSVAVFWVQRRKIWK